MTHTHSLRTPPHTRTHTHIHTHTEGDLYRQPAERERERKRERERSALRNRKVHREESGRQKVREGEGGRWLLSISCAPFHSCTLTDLKVYTSSSSYLLQREIKTFAKKLFLKKTFGVERDAIPGRVFVHFFPPNQVFPSLEKF